MSEREKIKAQAKYIWRMSAAAVRWLSGSLGAAAEPRISSPAARSRSLSPLLHSTAKNAGATVPRAAPLAALSHDNFVTAQGSRVIQNEHIRSLMILLLYASITMPRHGQKPGNSGRGARENEPSALGADGRFWRAAPRGDTAAKCAGDADSPERRLPTVGVAFGFRAEFRPWCVLMCVRERARRFFSLLCACRAQAGFGSRQACSIGGAAVRPFSLLSISLARSLRLRLARGRR